MCYDLTVLGIFGSSLGKKNHRLFTRIGQYNNIIYPLKAACARCQRQKLAGRMFIIIVHFALCAIISKDGDILSIILHCMRLSAFLIFVQEAMELSREGTHFILRIFLM